MSNNKILVVGSANTDLVIHTDRMPKIGETITGSDFAINAGGKGLNQAVAIAKLGNDVSFLGAVGNDINGTMLIDTLKGYGIDFIGKRVDGVATGTAVITVVNGDNCIILDEGANGTVSPQLAEENAEKIKNSDFVVLQLEIPLETVVKVCEIAKEGNTKVILNPAPYKDLPEKIYSMIDFLIPNEHEAENITGIKIDSDENCIKAVNKIMEYGVKNVIITLGEKGCVYNDGSEIFFSPAVKCKVVDTTCAGDSFIGALLVKLSQNKPLDEAVKFAGKVASVTVSRQGAAKSVPCIEELKEYEI
jgi:ribokinase